MSYFSSDSGGACLYWYPRSDRTQRALSPSSPGHTCLWNSGPSLRLKLEKEQDLRKKLEKKSKSDDTQAEPNSDWAEQIEVEQPSSSLLVFGSADLRAKDVAAVVRSNLAFKIKSFGLKEGKKEYRDKASSENLKRHLKRIGEKGCHHLSETTDTPGL